MSRTILIGLVVVLLAIAGAGVYFLTRGNTNTSFSDNQSDQSEETNDASFASVANGGKALRCTFTYDGEDGSGSGTVYGDGDGRGLMIMDINTAKGNTGTSKTLVTSDKAYGWFESNGQKTGFTYDKSTFENRETSQTSSTGGTDPNRQFTMDCDPWTVDESLLSVPDDVNFMTLPATPVQN